VGSTLENAFKHLQNRQQCKKAGSFTSPKPWYPKTTQRRLRLPDQHFKRLAVSNASSKCGDPCLPSRGKGIRIQETWGIALPKHKRTACESVPNGNKPTGAQRFHTPYLK